MVIQGLVGKYGFSESGAYETANLIERGANFMGESPLKNVRFGSEEKRIAAEKAFDFYWS